MSDKLSFSIHIAASQGSPQMTDAIAFECQTIVRRAAEPVEPGDTVKAQLNRAWVALGRPPFWRVRSAWYGESGGFSAAAVRDLQDRFLRWRDRRDREAAAARATKAAVRAATDAQRTEDTRAELAALRLRLDQLEEALRLQG